MKKYRYLIWILPVLAAILIFYFSAQPGEESSQLSNGVVLKLLDLLSRWNPSLDPAEFLERMSTPVRKAAHITEYLIFYITLLSAYHVTGFRRLRWICSSVLTAFLYACTDEMNQFFVDRRAGRFTDVLIDCSGIAVLSVVLIFVNFYRRNKEKSL
ncbi:MAG: VanZ family protein [Lachnospiraceae bacterium]|nr:VanZ family protein [Lachnospiraceae bacterium]